MSWWLVIAVLVAPMAVNPFGGSQTIMQAKSAMLIHLGLGCAAWAIPHWWCRALLLSAWLSFLVNGMHGFLFLGLLGVVAWALFFHHAAALSESGWQRIRLALAVAVGVQLAWMGVQFFGWDPIFRPIDAHGVQAAGLVLPLIGWFSNTSDLALFFALSVPALFGVHPLLAGLAATAAVALRSSAAVVALGIFGLWWAGRYGRRALLGACLGLLVAGSLFLVFVDPPWRDGAMWRSVVWRTAVNVIALRPITGYGFNALEYSVIIDSPVGRWNYLQNEWLQLALETGGLGLAVVTGYVGRLLWRMAAAWDRLAELVPAALMLLAVSLVSIPFRIGPVALLAALYLGRIERRLQEG